MIIRFSNLDSHGHRIDSEYYSSEFVEITNGLNKLESKERIKKLHKIADIKGSAFYGSITQDYQDDGEAFVRVSDIKNMTVSKQKLVYLPDTYQKYANQIAHTTYGSLVLAKTGSIGKIGMIPKELGNCRISRDVLAIEPFDQNITSEYLMAFLNCKYGLKQLHKLMTTQVQPHLELKLIKHVRIPILPKKFRQEITRWVRKAIEYRKMSIKILHDVDVILFNLLEIQNTINKSSFIKKFSNIEDGNRIDSEYYQPLYDSVLSKIKKFETGYSNLLDTVSISTDVIDYNNEKEGEYLRYIDLSSIDDEVGVISSHDMITSNKHPSRAKMRLSKNNVLVSTIQGSFDKIAIVDNQYDNSIGSSGFIVLQPKTISSQYLFALFRNPIIQFQLQKFTTGSILSSISKSDIKKIIIPNIQNNLQADITNSVKESFYLQKKSSKILDDVKESIENTINSNVF